MGRITARSDFEAFRFSRNRATRSGVKVTFVAAHEGLSAAFAITKKAGGAVVRNKARRRVRHILSFHQNELVAGRYLISLSADAVDLDFNHLETAVLSACRAACRIPA